MKDIRHINDTVRDLTAINNCDKILRGVIDVFTKSNIQKSIKGLVKDILADRVSFDHIIQRKLVWNKLQKSLLIHSAIVDYPIPPLYARVDNGKLDMLDGKQRSHAFKEFVCNEYLLQGLPPIQYEVLVKDEATKTNAYAVEIIDLNGLKFDELPDELKEKILDFQLTVYRFENMTDQEAVEMFVRLNNGKPLSAIEKTRATAKSIDIINDIAKHPLFEVALSEKVLSTSYKNEDIVIKAWALLYAENPSFETKFIRPLLHDAEIASDQAEELRTVFTHILDAHIAILNFAENKAAPRQAKKIAKRMLLKTHLLSLVPVAQMSVNANQDVAYFADFVFHFFNGNDTVGDNSASVSSLYNDNITDATSSGNAVKNRLEAILSEYKSYSGQ